MYNHHHLLKNVGSIYCNPRRDFSWESYSRGQGHPGNTEVNPEQIFVTDYCAMGTGSTKFIQDLSTILIRISTIKVINIMTKHKCLQIKYIHWKKPKFAPLQERLEIEWNGLKILNYIPWVTCIVDDHKQNIQKSKKKMLALCVWLRYLAVQLAVYSMQMLLSNKIWTGPLW